MGKIYESISELVGGTPLLRLKRYEQKYGLRAEIYAKLEYFNPNQSSKDRIAVAMIEDAEKKGRLKPGDTIWELTSGNTGIGVAAVAASKGYSVRILLEDDANEERFRTIRAFGGEAVTFSEDPALSKALNNPDYSFVYAVKKFKEAVKEEKRDIFFLDQDNNDANPNIHETTTGPEIWEDTDGNVDFLVAGTGTGGTISGAGKYLKQRNKNIKIVSVQPGPLTRKNLENPDGEGIPGIHALDCIPEERIPHTMNMDIVDEFFNVEAKEAKQAAREVARTDGILVGYSSGAALYTARQLAQRSENEGKKIVVILPDTGLRYFSTDLFDV
ncbi:MAG: PLP-dependent cysteine synthase family protein [Firmicutes bacterium]|nr:PLP-dependent cysteine synthase family protein [Bacillota bacterium]